MNDPTRLDHAKYLSAARMLESWRMEENVARALKERADRIQLVGGSPEALERAIGEAKVARTTANSLRDDLLIRIGED